MSEYIIGSVKFVVTEGGSLVPKPDIDERLSGYVRCTNGDSESFQSGSSCCGYDREEIEEALGVTSDGGATSYYELPEHATELRHLISHKDMSKSRGDVFKACYRLGEKNGTDIMYDLTKMKFFIEDLIEMHGRGERL